MKRPRIDVDSIEFRLFDRRGRELFKWRKVPNNIGKGIKVMKEKGIDLRRLVNEM